MIVLLKEGEYLLIYKNRYSPDLPLGYILSILSFSILVWYQFIEYM